MSTIGFYGGVGSVTGANFVLDTGEVAIMVDCGLIQGDRFSQEQNAEPFVYNPKDIDVLLVTHAHADHIGRIPKLVKDGFRGRIYSTAPTKALAEIMLDDALHVMQFEAERHSLPVLYSEGDIQHAFSIWDTTRYDEPFSLGDGVEAVFTNAGHILGSAMVQLTRNGKKFVFTGDVGNVPQPLMAPPVIPEDYDYMVMESVYGDRLHEEVEERTELLLAQLEGAKERKGTLIIPAFSLERTQGILFEINNLVESGRFEPIPVFLDSPLAIRVTEIYRQYPEYLKPEIWQQVLHGDDIFAFKGLSFTPTVQDSAEIDFTQAPKVIIAGSGMSHGGRIRRHERRYLGDPNTTLLLVGYQSVGSVGRLLHDGAKKIRIDGTDVRVRARIERIRGFSGHADRDQLIDLVAQGGDKAKQVFVTMGEEKSSLFLTQRLRDYLGVNAIAPDENQEIEVDF
ncbi:MAG: MBL fold metallo-hydrolase [Patescibacteria group bacterium]